MREIWINKQNRMIEVSWDEQGTSCFYRGYPRAVKYRQWEGFITRTQLDERGYRYLKDSND